MSTDELVLHKDYEEFASSYLGVEYEDYVELMGDFELDEDVRKQLLQIGQDFFEGIEIQAEVKDIVLCGSLCNYNWSEKYSDFDLHIIIDFNDVDDNYILVEQLCDYAKKVWNAQHDIKIKGYDVELYVQDSNEKHLSTGVYSILNNKWIIEPKKGKEFIDDRTIMEKGQEYGELIDSLVKSSELGKDVSKDVDDVKTKLKQFRQSGLEKGGEYSYENLTFKLLRRNGYIEKLMSLKNNMIDKKLSVS